MLKPYFRFLGRVPTDYGDCYVWMQANTETYWYNVIRIPVTDFWNTDTKEA